MAFLAGRMIWEFGYRRSKMEKIYRRIRTVYTIANTEYYYWTHCLCRRSIACDGDIIHFQVEEGAVAWTILV